MSRVAPAGARPALGWIDLADRALGAAQEKIRLIRAVTPVDADSEITAVEAAAAGGRLRPPRLRYDPPPVSPELLRALERIAHFVEGEGAIGALYAARALELALEGSMVAAVGTPRLGQLAALRFAETTPQDRADGARADRLADDWIDLAPAPASDERTRRTCDAGDPSSLVSLMRAEVGRRRLPMRVVLQPGLASLAATGEGTIFVAEKKWAAPVCIARTVHHEIHGHAMPRCRALRERPGIFAVGTARGLDDQEGRALLLERRAGFLNPRRKRELGLRHVAARAVLAGADWVEIVQLLLDRGASATESVHIAVRVTRGGAAATFAGGGAEGGLAREVVYLPAMLRVERAMRANGAVRDVMARGRIAANAAPLVAAAGNVAVQNEAERREQGNGDAL